MVMARLHIICGNCGCNDMFGWKHDEREEYECEVMTEEDVSLYCRNCGTIHSLNDNADLAENEQ